MAPRQVARTSPTSGASRARFWAACRRTRPADLGIEARDLAMKLLQDDGLNPFVFKFSDVQQIIFPSDYYDKMLQSPLGGFVDGLKHLSQSAVVAIALVDGGIERIKKDSADSCVTEMLKSFILPWDCLPNSLYVFGPHVQDHASSVG